MVKVGGLKSPSTAAYHSPFGQTFSFLTLAWRAALSTGSIHVHMRFAIKNQPNIVCMTKGWRFRYNVFGRWDYKLFFFIFTVQTDGWWDCLLANFKSTHEGIKWIFSSQINCGDRNMLTATETFSEPETGIILHPGSVGCSPHVSAPWIHCQWLMPTQSNLWVMASTNVWGPVTRSDIFIHFSCLRSLKLWRTNIQSSLQCYLEYQKHPVFTSKHDHVSLMKWVENWPME